MPTWPTSSVARVKVPASGVVQQYLEAGLTEALLGPPCVMATGRKGLKHTAVHILRPYGSFLITTSHHPPPAIWSLFHANQPTSRPTNALTTSHLSNVTYFTQLILASRPNLSSPSTRPASFLSSFPTRSPLGLAALFSSSLPPTLYPSVLVVLTRYKPPPTYRPIFLRSSVNIM
ncbi:unnamed protein product [Protopolystoma xenopodis]|uniref:Uncharacterized protein n=1 Tax=Protopolystoma xenopodis TaxID=117903 RepID=A0A3S5AUZ0_9PLAT|nr:unnamed protein product [Protopolystoma xenopodis]